MGHIVFAAPGIDRYHLHERLGRELRQNGHTIDVLCVDPVEHTFWRHQEGNASLVREGAADAMRAPLDDLAARECARLGLAPTHHRHANALRLGRRRLSRLLPALLRWFEQRRPDLVLLHQRRHAEHGLLQFVARETGTRVLWTGDGLLPHTLQVDERGLDGEAAATLRHAGDYRVVRGEPSLLDACLTNTMARAAPSALTRREVRIPRLWSRLADAGPAVAARGWTGLCAALSGWRQAAVDDRAEQLPEFDLPAAPFVALLLQDDADDRLRLDATAPPAPRELILAAAAAANRVDPALRLAVVLPWRGIHHRQFAGLCAVRGLHVVAAHAAPEAAATAIATITVNHPLAAVALLAGTPVVHIGRALYGLPGVTTHAPCAGLAEALSVALAKDHPTLRQRFLSWLLGYGHVWCSSQRPDHNGLAGLVQAIETRLAERSQNGLRLRYRPGPAWPLAAEGRGH